MTSPLSHECILVVEDDRDTRDALIDILEAAGYTVASAANGEEALSRLRGGPLPCIILLDLMMPVMDGWEFRKRQKEDPRFRAVPVVVVTGVETGSNEAGSLDVAGYLLKPIDLDRLLDAVAHHCG